jgi:hypothetical protein
MSQARTVSAAAGGDPRPTLRASEPGRRHGRARLATCVLAAGVVMLSSTRVARELRRG